MKSNIYNGNLGFKWGKLCKIRATVAAQNYSAKLKANESTMHGIKRKKGGAKVMLKK